MTRHRFSADEYHRMVEVGLLHEDDRVELLDGEVVEMAPIGSPHARSPTSLAVANLFEVIAPAP